MTPIERLKHDYNANCFSVRHLDTWINDCKIEAKIYINNIDYHALGATEEEAIGNLESYVNARITNPYGEYRR